MLKPRQVLEPSDDNSGAQEIAERYIVEQEERKAAEDAAEDAAETVADDLPAGMTQEEYDRIADLFPPGYTPEFSSDGQTLIGATDPYGQSFTLTSGMATQQQYFPPPRLAINPATGERFDDYTGEGIVNYATNQFELSTNEGLPRSYMYEDAQNEFFTANDSLRERLLDDFEWLGLPADTTLEATDSLWQVMRYANGLGYDYKYALTGLKTRTPQQVSQQLKNYVTPKVSLSETANRMAQETLGRKFTAEELNRFVAAYNQAELAPQQQESGVVTSAPSVGAAATQYARNVAPNEAKAYEYLNAMNTFSQMVGKFGG